MPVLASQWSDILCCGICDVCFDGLRNLPVSLGCSHTICKGCLLKLPNGRCPVDQYLPSVPVDALPENLAVLKILGISVASNYERLRYSLKLFGGDSEYGSFVKAVDSLVGLTLFLRKSTSERGKNVWSPSLSKSMQRKVVALLCVQLAEPKGRCKGLKAARLVADRCLFELQMLHQNHHSVTTDLWTAVRSRGCQFLGPAMQEEVLKLVLTALSDGASLSRKVLVMYIVQRLEKDYPQASKTSVGHVVQMLYRASCFAVIKREGQSSLMQLKEEFLTYDALRHEHDSQMVQIAMEAGLRLSPDQWSSLLYGDQSKKPHMQSIIDKLQTPQAFMQSVEEVLANLQRSGCADYVVALRKDFTCLSASDTLEDESEPQSWEVLLKAFGAISRILTCHVKLVTQRSHKTPCATGNGYAETQSSETESQLLPYNYKTSMCRDVDGGRVCPRPDCTFAHSAEELQLYRNRCQAARRSGSSRDPESSVSSVSISERIKQDAFVELQRQRRAARIEDQSRNLCFRMVSPFDRANQLDPLSLNIGLNANVPPSSVRHAFNVAAGPFHSPYLPIPPPAMHFPPPPGGLPHHPSGYLLQPMRPGDVRMPLPPVKYCATQPATYNTASDHAAFPGAVPPFPYIMAPPCNQSGYAVQGPSYVPFTGANLQQGNFIPAGQNVYYYAVAPTQQTPSARVVRSDGLQIDVPLSQVITNLDGTPITISFPSASQFAEPYYSSANHEAFQRSYLQQHHLQPVCQQQRLISSGETPVHATLQHNRVLSRKNSVGQLAGANSHNSSRVQAAPSSATDCAQTHVSGSSYDQLSRNDQISSLERQRDQIEQRLTEIDDERISSVPSVSDSIESEQIGEKISLSVASCVLTDDLFNSDHAAGNFYASALMEHDAGHHAAAGRCHSMPIAKSADLPSAELFSSHLRPDAYTSTSASLQRPMLTATKSMCAYGSAAKDTTPSILTQTLRLTANGDASSQSASLAGEYNFRQRTTLELRDELNQLAPASYLAQMLRHELHRREMASQNWWPVSSLSNDQNIAASSSAICNSSDKTDFSHAGNSPIHAGFLSTSISVPRMANVEDKGSCSVGHAEANSSTQSLLDNKPVQNGDDYDQPFNRKVHQNSSVHAMTSQQSNNDLDTEELSLRKQLETVSLTLRHLYHDND